MTFRIGQLKRAAVTGCLLLCMTLVAASCDESGGKKSAHPYEAVPLGSVLVIPETRELVMTGYVNQVKGAIELLACGTGGKVHESTFVLFAEPRDLQAGLLLLGYKHGEPMPGLGQKPPEGDPVVLWVEWEDEGKHVRQPAEYFLYDYIEQGDVDHEAWVFNGSTIEDGLFMAGAEESLIATYWDPWAIINIRSEHGGNDERIIVHTDRMPPLHTPVRMIIAPQEDKRNP